MKDSNTFKGNLLSRLTVGLLSLTVVLFASFLSLQTLSAQAYRGIILDKFRFDYNEVVPGQVINDTFTLTYDFQPLADGSYKEVVMYPLPRNFEQNLDGTSKLVSIDALAKNASLADWMTFDAPAYVLNQPEQKVNINFTITVPENAEPGGKYAIAFMGNKSGDSVVAGAQEGDALAGLNSAGGPLIFLTVGGESNKNLELVDIYTTNIKGKKNWFFLNPPVNVVVEIKNNGNVHVAPRGRVYIHTSKDYVASHLFTVDLNDSNKVILPGATRQFVFPWNDSFIYTEAVVIRGDVAAGIRLKPGDVGYEESTVVIDTEYKTRIDWNKLSKLRIGKYQATAQFNYVDSNDIATSTIEVNTNFYVIPLFILIILLIILVLITLFILSKKYKNNEK